ncbi:MAG: NAD(P)-dependent oxidoreductase [Candidatus Omnitrophica bacterium]|nr:NAD(P)-dependent oxidoreductase [Candidatus Omnitrophota bacterium]MDD5080975.1 NAD(P)-dependent oxidoreductase [Candidatus Omnitrophota bacterium]MDD5441230.1 NAD(P)-dependent oxidoreductase [Candidatus Omnitrophota bacterium]
MKILVTGATGFIGRNLVRKLVILYPEAQITCLVRCTSNTTSINDLGLKFIITDISDYNELIKINTVYDFIFHCAGCVSNKSKTLLKKYNIEATENVYRYALETGSGKVIYTSSVATVSGNPQNPLTENLPYMVSNLYGWSKMEAEKSAIKYRALGVKTAIIRPTMIYGKDEPHLLKLIVNLIKHRLFFIWGNADIKFHLVYIDNVVDCLIDAMSNNGYLAGTYFISDNEVLTFGQVMDIIASALHVRPPIRMSKKIINILRKIPIIKDKINAVFKDREFPNAALKSIGFIPQYEARNALMLTAKSIAERPSKKS